MAASSVAEAFDWTPFSHGFVFWESPKAEHGPPSDQAGQREWLQGFQQAHADYPNESDDPDHPEGGETAADALRRMLQMHSINRNISKRFLKYYRSPVTAQKQTSN